MITAQEQESSFWTSFLSEIDRKRYFCSTLETEFRKFGNQAFEFCDRDGEIVFGRIVKSWNLVRVSLDIISTPRSGIVQFRFVR